MAEMIQPGAHSSIQHIVAVMSGKGGTGKSTITALLASALQQQGQRVGILDADLACPSIARLFRLEDEPPMYTGEGFEPPLSKNGVKVISVNMSESEEDPLAWRGPMVSSALKQFYSQVDWGDLDLLLVDVPAGTADVPMTVLQSLPLDGVIIVTTPQAAVLSSAKKCLNMAGQYQQRVLGIVENMTTFLAPDGENYPFLSLAANSELTSMAHAPLLAQLPFDPQLATLSDVGRVDEYASPACAALATNVLNSLEAGQA